MEIDLFLLFPVFACGVAVVQDLRSREISDWLSIIIIAIFPVRMMIGEASPWWQHLIGGALAMMLGLVVGRHDRFGGGDIKLFAALGLWFGVSAVVPLALWIAIAGLPLAIIAAVRKQTDFAYAPAIFVGVCVHVLVPDLLVHIAT
jgi:Flp pilus assembly protein protease CpaA